MIEPTDNPSMPKRSRKRRNLYEKLAEENQESRMMIEDHQEVVLTWLPVVVLYRLHVVSRRWNSLLTSPNFQQRWGEVAPTKQPWFLSRMEELVSDPCMTPSQRNGCIVPGFFFVEIHLTNVERGMVTFLDKDTVTSTWRSKIVLVDNRGNYEVFTISNNIRCESPMITGKMPSHIEASSTFSSSVVSIGTDLLFLGLEPYGIISYNVENGEWEQLIIPRPLNSSNVTLTKCNSRLLLTSIVRNTNSSTISIRLETRVMRMWMEIDRMPSSPCFEFEGKAGSVYECLCNKNVIVILLRTNQMSRLYTYDVMGREWSKVPKLSFPKKRHVSIISGIDFFPNFAIPIHALMAQKVGVMTRRGRSSAHVVELGELGEIPRESNPTDKGDNSTVIRDKNRVMDLPRSFKDVVLNGMDRLCRNSLSWRSRTKTYMSSLRVKLKVRQRCGNSRFEKKEQMEWVMSNGPWLVKGSVPLMLKIWNSGYDMNDCHGAAQDVTGEMGASSQVKQKGSQEEVAPKDKEGGNIIDKDDLMDIRDRMLVKRKEVQREYKGMHKRDIRLMQ
ncbi:LOW QUALITY PROTEIN: hypothetical protein V2J09_021646 [Rumex salicifolius]